MYVYRDVFAKNNGFFVHVDQFLDTAACAHVCRLNIIVEFVSQWKTEIEAKRLSS